MQLVRLIVHTFWKTALFLSALAGVVYLPADVWGLTDTYPWLAPMGEVIQDQAAWWLLGFAALYIGWIDARPLIKAGFAGKSIVPRNPLSRREGASLPDQNQDLIPINIVVSGQKVEDGVDLRLCPVIRNRSPRDLVVKFDRWSCEIAGTKPTSGDRASLGAEMKGESNQRITLPRIRIYNPTGSMTGTAAVSLSFGPDRGTMEHLMVARFTVQGISIPDKVDQQGRFQIAKPKYDLDLEYGPARKS